MSLYGTEGLVLPVFPILQLLQQSIFTLSGGLLAFRGLCCWLGDRQQ